MSSEDLMIGANRPLFNDLYVKGYENIIENDLKFQRTSVVYILQSIRNLNLTEEQAWNLATEYKMIYIPNDNYMKLYFGDICLNSCYDFYVGSDKETCKFYQRLVIPILDFDNQVVALCGYANDSEYKYVYSNQYVWDKGNYIFLDGDKFERAISDGYCFVTDGIFDTIHLRLNGINSACLMDSNITKNRALYFSFIEKIVLVPDNDNAGKLLIDKFRRNHSNVTALKQGKEKDIDDFLKQPNAIIRLKKAFAPFKEFNSESVRKFIGNNLVVK